jgi:hypothetical protein
MGWIIVNLYNLILMPWHNPNPPSEHEFSPKWCPLSRFFWQWKPLVLRNSFLSNIPDISMPCPSLPNMTYQRNCAHERERERERERKFSIMHISTKPNVWWNGTKKSQKHIHASMPFIKKPKGHHLGYSYKHHFIVQESRRAMPLMVYPLQKAET